MAGLKSLAKDTAIYGLSSIVGRSLTTCWYLCIQLYYRLHRRLRSRIERVCVYSPDARTAYVRYGNGILPFRQ